jgi:hypothetical protein
MWDVIMALICIIFIDAMWMHNFGCNKCFLLICVARLFIENKKNGFRKEIMYEARWKSSRPD